MNSFWTLFTKELKAYFISPIAYLLLFGMMLINGFSFYVWIAYMTEANVKDISVYQAMVNSFFFWISLFLLAPLLTMRSFSEEYKTGTIEMLLSAPIREWEVVWAKFASSLVFYGLLWSSIPINLLLLHLFSNTPNQLSSGSIVLPLVMILLLGSFFLSIGIFTSSLTRNQIIAALLSFVIIFLLFCLNFLTFTDWGRANREFFNYLSAGAHMDTFTKGVFDSRPVVLYVSGTVFFLFLTQRILEGRRLRA